MKHEIQIEKYGGDVPCVECSAKTSTGLKELEETILVQSELMDHLLVDKTADPELVVLEARQVRGKGYCASILVQQGSLKSGDILVFGGGRMYGRVRSMINDCAEQIKQAEVSLPVEVSGSWKELPLVGETIQVAKTEKEAKQMLSEYQWLMENSESTEKKPQQAKKAPREYTPMELLERKKSRLPVLKKNGPLSVYLQYCKDIRRLEREIAFSLKKAKETSQKENDCSAPKEKELQIVLKADVHGSLEALQFSLQELQEQLSQYSDNESSDLKEIVKIKVLHSSVGPVTPSDIDLLRTSSNQRCMVCFNVPEPPKLLQQSLQEHKIPLLNQSIIYKLMDEMRLLVQNLLPPQIVYDPVGRADILAIFPINNGKDVIAGCRVVDGQLLHQQQQMNLEYRITRKTGKVVFQGPLKSLKHHKKDMKMISKGMECGLAVHDFVEYEVGDVIECLEKKIVERKLE